MDKIPILRIGGILLVSIQIDLQDNIAVALQDDLSNEIVRTGAKGVVIDISALEIVDSFIGRMISTTAAVSRVLDAETVVVGMQPAVLYPSFGDVPGRKRRLRRPEHVQDEALEVALMRAVLGGVAIEPMALQIGVGIE